MWFSEPQCCDCGSVDNLFSFVLCYKNLDLMVGGFVFLRVYLHKATYLALKIETCNQTDAPLTDCPVDDILIFH